MNRVGNGQPEAGAATYVIPKINSKTTERVSRLKTNGPRFGSARNKISMPGLYKLALTY
jgi:hypothetical protein